MKKILTNLIILGSFAIHVVHGREAQTQQTESFNQKHPHHIYFGPEAFWFNLNTHFKDVKVNGSKFFIGLRLGYEYLKPKAFYFGIDLMGAGGNKGFSDSYKGYHFSKSNGLTGFGNIELRFGYTFSPRKGLVTPFLGMGGYSFGYGSHHHHFDEGISYLTGGFRSQCELTPVFSLGWNLKAFASIYRDERFKFWGIKRTDHHGGWGGEIGLPLMWHVGSAKRWDIQLQPYFLSLKLSERQNIYGTRLLFEYRF